MKIAIGTKSPPKVEAIRQAIIDCVYLDDENIEIITEKVDSGISDMPISLEENILGAKNRASNLKNDGIEADLYIGMEGGTTEIGEHSYLFGAVYIMDNSGKSHLGLSPMMQLPDVFHTRIYKNGEELGPVLAEISGVEGASQKTGSFGHWSDDMLTRKDQFMLAFTAAICPFYNKYYKM